MSETTATLMGMAIAATVSGTVILVLRARLRQVLDELCGSTQRGAFWSTLTSVLLILTPVTFSLLPRYDGSNPVEDGLIGLKWGLFGLIVALAIVATLIARFASLDIRKRSKPSETL